MEKRQFVRCAMEEKVRLIYGNGVESSAHTMDISECGMRIRFDEFLEVGASVSIYLDFLRDNLPPESLKIDAQVMHRFKEPENETWQIGMKLKFDAGDRQKTLQMHLASCRSTF